MEKDKSILRSHEITLYCFKFINYVDCIEDKYKSKTRYVFKRINNGLDSLHQYYKELEHILVEVNSLLSGKIHVQFCMMLMRYTR
jgi:GTP1/Obg family GTP-binding protein